MAGNTRCALGWKYSRASGSNESRVAKLKQTVDAPGEKEVKSDIEDERTKEQHF